MVPIESETTMSPSDIMLTGEIDRAMPSDANSASLRASSLFSAAFVATATRVVLPRRNPAGVPPRTRRALSANSEDSGDCRVPATILPVRIANVSHRIHHGQRRHEHPRGAPLQRHRPGSNPGLHRVSQAQHFAYGGPRACSHSAFLNSLRRGCSGRSLTHFARRPYARLTDSQIVKNRPEYDRDTGEWRLESDAFMFQPPPDSGRRFQPKGTAAREYYRVNPFGNVQWIEDAQLFGAAGRTAHVHARHRPRFAQHSRATSERVVIGYVSDLYSGDIGQAFH